MNEIKSPAQNRADDVTRTAFWGTLALAVIDTLICSYFFVVMSRQAGNPVTYTAMAVFLLAIATAVTGFVLTISRRQALAVKLLFYTIYVIGFSAVTLFEGRAVSSSFSILLIAVMVIQWLFPSHVSRRRYFAVVAAAFVLMWVIEWIDPAWRIPFEARTVGPGAVIGFALILGWIVFTQSRRFLAASIAASLRLQITVWTGAIILAVTVAAIGYSAYTTRQAAIESAQEQAAFITQAQAENVYVQIAPALETAQTMATTLGAVKDAENPVTLTREQVNGILKKVAEENPSFLGTWTLWEPNAFDGRDAEYANTPIHDATGRFIPYWVRVDAETVEGVAIIDYETETPGLNDWYFVPRNTGQLTLIPPYFYPINGVDVLMTTVSVPIVENGRFYGVTGVDYRVDFMQGLVDAVDLYNGSANAILLTNDGSLVAVRNQPELALESAVSVFEDFSEIQPQLASGEPFVSVSPDGQFLRVFAPVKLAEGADWSFALVIPFSEITAPATALALQEAAISAALIGLALLFLWYLTGLLVRPISELTSVANAISGGDLNATASVKTENEIGILANTFNAMTARLRETLSGLEQRVADRTRNLELAAEVGRAVSQVRSLDVMLKDACELILKEFNLYYVQVYLTGPSGSNLKLEAGTGSVGAQLTGRGHSLPLNTGSINGRAAVEKRSVVISDTTQSATFRQNPLLPETRGEMAVPLIVANKVVGVLDMQSNTPGVLTEEILPAFEALAGQLAVAVQNANLLAETEQARAQVEAQARRLVRTGWNDYLDAIHKPEQLGFVYDSHTVTPLTDTDASQVEDDKAVSAPIAVTGEPLGALVVELDDETRREQTNELVNVVARQVAQQIENLRLLESAERYRYEAEESARRQTLEGWQKYVEARNAESLGYVYDTQAVRPYTHGSEDGKFPFTLPLKAREELIGRLSVAGLTAEDESAALVHEVAERLSAHIENLRLFEETRQGQLELDKRAKQLAAVAEISTASSQELEVDKLLDTVVHLTQRQFGLYHAHVFVYNDATQELEIQACGWHEGSEHEGTHETVSIPLDREQSLVARAARTGRAVIVNDVKSEPGFLPNPLLPDTRSEMAVPLVVGDQVLGVLDVQADRVNAFTDEDANIQTTLASQVATAMQNARSFSQAQKQAEREAMLNVINQKIQSATSVEAVLQIAARELGHALGAPMTIAQLSLKDNSS